MGTKSYGFTYDPIGNRITHTENALTTRYKANELNQYTNIANGAVEEPIYDVDGNMLSHDGWQLVWDGEPAPVPVTVTVCGEGRFRVIAQVWQIRCSYSLSEGGCLPPVTIASL